MCVYVCVVVVVVAVAAVVVVQGRAGQQVMVLQRHTRCSLSQTKTRRNAPTAKSDSPSNQCCPASLCDVFLCVGREGRPQWYYAPEIGPLLLACMYLCTCFRRGGREGS